MKTKPTHGGKRNGAGRTTEYSARRTVRLSAQQDAKAKQLGNGDVSAGIRLLIDRALKEEK